MRFGDGKKKFKSTPIIVFCTCNNLKCIPSILGI
jgi:hypothetical protein